MRSLALALLMIACQAGYAAAEADPIDHSERATLALSLSGGTLLAVTRTVDGASHDQAATGLGLLDEDAVGLKNEGTVAIALSFMQPLMRNFALGAEAQVRDWATREDYQLGYPRYQALDFSVIPRGQLPLGRRVFLMATLPFGGSLSFIDADIEHRTFREEASTGSGFNLGLFAGVSITLHPRFGVRAELGLARHWLNHTWRYTSTTSEPFVHDREEVRYATTTLLLRSSFYFAL